MFHTCGAKSVNQQLRNVSLLQTCRCAAAEILLLSYDTNNSRGSIAAHLRCGGICNDCCIINVLMSVPVKTFAEPMKFSG